jgi:hypothetical protein
MGKVIAISGSGFRLKELAGPSGKGLITSWLSHYPGARAKFRVRVKNLRSTPQTQWTKKQFRSLGNGLFEIKWKFSKKEFRSVGFYHGGFFVMLIGCTHKQNVYDPPSWLESAKYRKGEVENGQWNTVDHEP